MPGFRKPEKDLPMSSNDIVISVSNLSKCYQIYDTPRDRLKQFVVPRLQSLAKQAPKQYFREFWALKDVSFEVKRGETVGIIGRNGSGKSTLLQMICGTLNPTSGSIQTTGRVAALLELGSGFNPEFTGRENVYMNGAVLGLSKDEIDARFDDIAAFADIGEFIEQPVKIYSSGMLVRLAFSVSVHVDASLLIVDEALAVGDIAFQHKCFQRIKDLRERGTTILLVSHDLGAIVEFCNSVLVLDSGGKVFAGCAQAAVNQFKQLLSLGSAEVSCTSAKPSRASSNSPLYSAHSVNPEKDEYGDGTVEIFDWGLLAADGSPASVIESSDTVEILIFVRFNNHCARPIIGYFITDAKGREIVGTNTLYEGIAVGPRASGDEVCISFKQRLKISHGEYFLNIGCSEYVGENVIAHHRLYRLTSISIYSSKKFLGFCQLDSTTTLDILNA
jgi:ABC-type polysaccharide/polyol phosphate transport system ATPase subunit